MTTTSTPEISTGPTTPAAVRRAPAPTSPRHRFAWWLGGITLLGFLVRVANVLWWRPTTDGTGYHGYRLWGDAFYYHWQAERAGQGRAVRRPHPLVPRRHPAAERGPPAPVPDVPRALVPIGLDGVTAHRLASSVLGTATIVVIGLLARRLAGNAAGLIAAGIAAVYPGMWINDGMVLSETMAIFMTALALTAAYSFWRKPTMRRVAVLGVLCGLTALSRTELALLFPLVVIPLALLVKNVDWGRRLRLAVVAARSGPSCSGRGSSSTPHGSRNRPR